MSHQMPDKFDAHHRQQLSALVDGELPLDEARFLLRRLEHDEALSGCQERWQLLGDALRGQACAPAPPGFAERIQAAVAAEPAPVVAAMPATRQRRGGLLRWGGGAALAASVAAIALFMGREPLPGQAPLEQPTTIIASEAQLPPAPPRAPLNAIVVADAALAVAAVPAAAVNARRASATRTQQAAARSVASRSVVGRSAEPARAVASQPSPALDTPAAGARTLPFSAVGNLQARPWPRSTLGNSGALNASFSTQEPQAAFYPFEPRLQDDAGDAPPARRQRD